VVIALTVFLVLVVVTVAATTVTTEGSAVRAPIHQVPLVAGLVAVVVGYSLMANTTVLDRLFYTEDLSRASGRSLPELFDPASFAPNATEPIYLVLLWFMAQFGTSTAVFYLVIALASSILYLWPVISLLGWWRATYVFLLALVLGTFTSYTSIVARQSIAMALLSAAICWGLIGRRRTLALLLAVAAALTHWSAAPFALAVIVLMRVRVPVRVALAVWGICALLFVTGSQARVLGPLTAYIPKQQDYTASSLASVYTGGVNRLDFLAASAAMLGLFLLAQHLLDLPEWYARVLVAFTVFNAVFLLGGFVYYSDRLAAYSWYLAPLLAAAPIVSRPSAKSRTMGVMVAVAAGGLAVLSGPFSVASPLWSLT
jgi:hypothetical protein